MSAVGFLCLILFIIGLCLAVYYAYICYDVPSSRTHSVLLSEDGPLLKYPNDLNGNESVSIPIERIDEPDDVVGCQDDLANGDAEATKGSPELTNPSAPNSALHQKGVTHCEIEHVRLEREMPNEARLLMDIEPVHRLPNTDEEDGLVYSREQVASAASILASGRLNSCVNGDKHVHFPYIDHGDDDAVEGTSCDQSPPASVTRKIKPEEVVNGRMPLMNVGEKRNLISTIMTKEDFYNHETSVKVQVALAGSEQSSCEELRQRSSDSDTSEPDVTEYSFNSSNISSTSDILAGELSTVMDPIVTKMATFDESTTAFGNKAHTQRVSSSKSCSADSPEEITCLPPENHLSINTPPNTPPEVDLRAIISNPSAKMFSKPSKGASLILAKNYRSSSVSSSSSMSADELEVTNTKATAALLKK